MPESSKRVSARRLFTDSLPRMRRSITAVIVYAIVDDALLPDFPLGVELETFISREDAERFIEEVRGDDPEVAAKLRIEEGRPSCAWGGLSADV